MSFHLRTHFDDRSRSSVGVRAEAAQSRPRSLSSPSRA